MTFFKPPKERTRIPKYADHTNRPVNSAKILTIKKGRENYYPDNEGIPTIEFWFGGEDLHQWFFDRTDEPLRDSTFDLLIDTDIKFRKELR